MPTLEAIREEKARRSLADWCTYVDDSYVVAAHHRKLIDALHRVERGELKRLMVSMPPRHGKSLTTTTRFPGWFLGRNPDKRVIIASNTASLAESFSRRCRNELTQWGPEVFGVEVADDSAAMNRWDLRERRGGLVAAGVGAAIAGRGADLLIIDDPNANAQSAESETQRRAQVTWYQQDARTRLHPGGSVVVVMTRWHEADLSGHLLEEAKLGGEQWEQLVLPMISDDGLILWPERWTPEECEGLRKSVGSRTWEAQYQQRPAPAEGTLLKREWWKFYSERPKVFDATLMSWDMTFKGTGNSDFVVGQVWGRAGANLYLLDQVRGRWDFPATCAQVKALAAKWPQTTTKLVEDKANGPAVISTLRNEVQGLIAVEPDGGKEARASAVSALIEAGNVFLPERSIAPWVDDFLLEATAFPFGAHDDQVDAMTQALNRLRAGTNKISKPSPPRERDGGVTM